jgi:hypothetical protein
LHDQLRVSTDYIKSFVQDNQAVFSSFSKQKEVLDSLIQYANVQATCYTDLKQEIQSLKQSQVKAQADGAKLNADLLTAVKEMISAIKAMKS